MMSSLFTGYICALVLWETAAKPHDRLCDRARKIAATSPISFQVNFNCRIRLEVYISHLTWTRKKLLRSVDLTAHLRSRSIISQPSNKFHAYFARSSANKTTISKRQGSSLCWSLCWYENPCASNKFHWRWKQGYARDMRVNNQMHMCKSRKGKHICTWWTCFSRCMRLSHSNNWTRQTGQAPHATGLLPSAVEYQVIGMRFAAHAVHRI